MLNRILHNFEKRCTFPVTARLVIIVLFSVFVTFLPSCYLLKIFQSSPSLPVGPPPPLKTYSVSPDVVEAKAVDILQDITLKYVVSSREKWKIEVYKDYDGEPHGFWKFKKIWQDRVKFYIRITPAKNQPGYSYIYIDAEAFTRIDENQPWKLHECPKTEERIAEILLIISSNIGK